MFYANFSPFYNKKILRMKEGKEEKGRRAKGRKKRGRKREKERKEKKREREEQKSFKIEMEENHLSFTK